MTPVQGIAKWDSVAKSFECDSPVSTLRNLFKIRTMKSLKWRLNNVYPQNHMRNLARKGCQNKYVFMTDVDIVPSKNIVEHLNNFFRHAVCSGRCAYVIPTYEIDLRTKFPETKRELIRLVKKGLARPFHEKVFVYNQFATNFSKYF